MDIEDVRVGLISFNSNVSLNSLQIQMAEGYKQKLSIDWQDYQKHWSYISNKIKTIHAITFLICNNHYPSILKEISSISFPSLQRIVLSGNHINSIQSLIKFDWPNLKELDLNNNLIVSTRSFAKINLKKLQKLSLTSNPLLHNQQFYKINSSFLKKLDLTSDTDLFKKYFIRPDPILWKFKLESTLPDSKQDNKSQTRRFSRVNYIRNMNQSKNLEYSLYANAMTKKQQK